LSSHYDSGTPLGDIIDVIFAMPNKQNAMNALTDASGYFLPNVIRAAADNSINKEVYSQLKNYLNTEISNEGIWGQMKGNYKKYESNENSPGDFIDQTFGAIFGYDKYFKENKTIFGVFAKIDEHNISQNQNSAKVTNAGAGVYGGYIRDRYEIKSIFNASYDFYETQRYINFVQKTANANWNGMQVGIDIEGALKYRLDELTDQLNDFWSDSILKAYLGFEISLSRYNGMKESGVQALNLDVDGNTYNRTLVRLGAGLTKQINKFDLSAFIEYKHLLSNNEPFIKAEFEYTNAKFEPVGTQEGKNIIGLCIGASYMVYENLALFANTNFFTAENYKNLYGNIGVNWRFSFKDNYKETENSVIIEAKPTAQDETKVKNLYEELERIKEMLRELKEQKNTVPQQEQVAYTKDALEDIRRKITDIEKDLQELRNSNPEDESFKTSIIQTAESLKEEEQFLGADLRRHTPNIKNFRIGVAHYKPNGFELTPMAKEIIKHHCEWIKRIGYNKVTVEGHADSSGSKFLNTRLSHQRAKAVYDEFVRNGISKNKIECMSLSDTMPIDTNKTVQGKAKNRRTEIFVE
jgi:outer membrane protein OmpA-like peptidoglycan-associated protein